MDGRIVKGIWIPIEIWEAEDLSWNEKILLMEIDSFTTKGKDCFISDEYISELLKVNLVNANRNVSSLIKKGYIKKTRFDGRRRYLQSLLCDKADLSQTIGQACLERQYTNSNIPIEEDKSSSNNNKRVRYDFKKALIEIGVSEQTAADWMEVRKAKGAANTETSFKGIYREICRSGMAAEECIRIAVENSWRGFKAEWMFNQQRAGGQTRKVSVLENNRNVAEELLRMSLNFES